MFVVFLVTAKPALKMKANIGLFGLTTHNGAAVELQVGGTQCDNRSAQLDCRALLNAERCSVQGALLSPALPVGGEGRGSSAHSSVSSLA